LGALDRQDAIALLSQVLTQHGWQPSLTEPGDDPQEVKDLVEAVDGHPRALVLLAPDLARQGVRATTQAIYQIMADLHRRYPNDREQSLYASVELSLRRLSPETRERIKVLGVFQGGAHLDVLRFMLGVDEDTVDKLGAELIQVGLAENKGYLHLRLDPALPSYLWAGLSDAERSAVEAAWAEVMMGLVDFLDQQRFQDPRFAVQLTLLELPNLLALLERQRATATPEQIVDLASKLEQFLAYLGRPQLLARVVALREQAAQALGKWSHARFQTERLSLDRRLDSGDLPGALHAAQALLQRCQGAGEAAYPEAAYDLAMSYKLLGQVLQSGGAATAALPPLTEAKRRFQALAEVGDANNAGHMVVSVMAERGSCLLKLGQLDAAADAYQEAIRWHEQQQDVRNVAIGKLNLGSVRLNQRRYAEALALYQEARDQFVALNEPGKVAATWDKIGIIHQEAGQFEPAEHAYLQSLAIAVRQNDWPGEAISLLGLGNLYDAINRFEEAANFYRQAAAIDRKLGNLFNEGRDCNNLANTLLKLGRYDDARRELQRAIECNKSYGHAAKPWITWATLHNLEQFTGHPAAAAQARQMAIESFIAYRQNGGENHYAGGQWCLEVAQAIHQGTAYKLAAELAQYMGPDTHPVVKARTAKLIAILAGSRDPTLADDPGLYYQDAVELRLLLESLNR
jgi:tetratricopeptide (TPR) repeat protein